MPAEHPVVITNLTKDYGRVRALDCVSWTVPPGVLLGFLGPNGAGKTTAIRILLGLLKPTAGRAFVHGLDVWSDSTQIRRRIGYLSGDVSLYKNLTGVRLINFVARCRKLTDRSEARRLADVFNIDLSTRVRDCSKGMRQKLGIILALMHRPKLLILDEPTAALDPLMQQELYRELRTVAAEGRTVLFSSHSLAEVDTLCDSVVILRAGRVVASSTVADLRSEAGQRVRVRLRDNSPLPTKYPKGFSPKKLPAGADHKTEFQGRWRGRPPALLAWLATLDTQEVSIEPADLEDLFLAYYNSDEDSDS